MYDIQCFQGDRIEALYKASKYAIETTLPDGSWVSLVDFDTKAVVKSEFDRVDSASRPNLVAELPQEGSGSTCIPCGLDEALSVCYHLSRVLRKRTFNCKPPSKIQISLRICAVWSQSSLSARRNVASLVKSKCTPANILTRLQKIRSLIWIFAGRICPTVRFFFFFFFFFFFLLWRCGSSII